MSQVSWQHAPAIAAVAVDALLGKQATKTLFRMPAKDLQLRHGGTYDTVMWSKVQL
jgi:hypothetical protein